MDAPPDNLELFSTIRLLVSPRRDQIKIPYISLHGQRISDGLQAFATAGTPQQQATGDVWAEGIEQAVRGEVNALSNDSWTARLESAQGHVSLHFRVRSHFSSFFASLRIDDLMPCYACRPVQVLGQVG